MGKFESFKKYLFSESISYEYIVPKDKETRLYDFYLWSLYYQLGLDRNHSARELYDEDTLADLQEIVDSSTNKMVEAQKEDLLDATLLSILSEFRHIIDRNEKGKIKTFINNNFPSLYPKFKAMMSSYLIGKTYPQFADDRKKLQRSQNKTTSPEYGIAKYAFDQIGWNHEQFVELAKKSFSELEWGSSFGGPAWGNICQAWLDLNSAKNVGSQIQAIDHIYDLEHNTGVMLNKVRRFDKEGFNWIKRALDLKFNADVWELMEKSSIPQRIVGPLNKLTNATKDYETFLKNKPNPDGFLAKLSDLYEKNIEMKNMFNLSIQKNYNGDGIHYIGVEYKSNIGGYFEFILRGENIGLKSQSKPAVWNYEPSFSIKDVNPEKFLKILVKSQPKQSMSQGPVLSKGKIVDLINSISSKWKNSYAGELKIKHEGINIILSFSLPVDRKEIITFTINTEKQEISSSEESVISGKMNLVDFFNDYGWPLARVRDYLKQKSRVKINMGKDYVEEIPDSLKKIEQLWKKEGKQLYMAKKMSIMGDYIGLTFADDSREQAVYGKFYLRNNTLIIEMGTKDKRYNLNDVGQSPESIVSDIKNHLSSENNRFRSDNRYRY